MVLSVLTMVIATAFLRALHRIRRRRHPRHRWNCHRDRRHPRRRGHHGHRVHQGLGFRRRGRCSHSGRAHRKPRHAPRPRGDDGVGPSSAATAGDIVEPPRHGWAPFVTRVSELPLRIGPCRPGCLASTVTRVISTAAPTMTGRAPENDGSPSSPLAAPTTATSFRSARMRVGGRGRPSERETTPNPTSPARTPEYTPASRSPSSSTPPLRRVLFGVDPSPSFGPIVGSRTPIASFTAAGPSTSTMAATTSHPSLLFGTMAARTWAPPFFAASPPEEEELDGPASPPGVTEADMARLGLLGAPTTTASMPIPATSPSGHRLLRRFAAAMAPRRAGLRPRSWSPAAMGLRIDAPFDGIEAA
uniref:Uncharacterized protein n=1 Tax=Arundo donax TaxID=35708 RepID=A0A0A8YS35_ARUDO